VGASGVRKAGPVTPRLGIVYVTAVRQIAPKGLQHGAPTCTQSATPGGNSIQNHHQPRTHRQSHGAPGPGSICGNVPTWGKMEWVTTSVMRRPCSAAASPTPIPAGGILSPLCSSETNGGGPPLPCQGTCPLTLAEDNASFRVLRWLALGHIRRDSG